MTLQGWLRCWLSIVGQSVVIYPTSRMRSVKVYSRDIKDIQLIGNMGAFASPCMIAIMVAWMLDCSAAGPVTLIPGHSVGLPVRATVWSIVYCHQIGFIDTIVATCKLAAFRYPSRNLGYSLSACIRVSLTPPPSHLLL